MDTLSLTKEAKIYNGVKTISLTSGAGKSGQPLVKERQCKFFDFFPFIYQFQYKKLVLQFLQTVPVIFFLRGFFFNACT